MSPAVAPFRRVTNAAVSVYSDVDNLTPLRNTSRNPKVCAKLNCFCPSRAINVSTFLKFGAVVHAIPAPVATKS